MGNLEKKSKMSAIQLGVIVASAAIGDNLITSQQALISDAKHASWLSVIICTLLIFVIAWMMIKLSNYYPNENFVEYMPKLWGPWLGSIFIWWYVILFFLVSSASLQGFSRVISFFLFDRTPPEIVTMSILIAVTYASLQTWGAILRVQQIIFFNAAPVFLLLWSLCLYSFQPENLLPLWPIDFSGVSRGVAECWKVFTGYEVILLLMPLVVRGKVSITKAVGAGIGCCGLILLIIVFMTIGVASVRGASHSPYPAITLIRSVELPSMFFERIESYLLLIWIPLVYTTLNISQYSMAKVLAEHYHYDDHRPYVLLITPLLLLSAVSLDSLIVYKLVDQFSVFMGLAVPAVFLPLSLTKAWLKSKSTEADSTISSEN